MKQSVLAFCVLLAAACTSTAPEPATEKVEEYWGSPNLVIQAFIPPVILAGEGDTIYLSDLTANVGDNISGVATVRYYISDASPVDVATASVIGERELREMKPKKYDESMEMAFVIPAGAGQPPLFLAACVDVYDVVDESYENDNCTTSPAGSNQLIFDSGALMPVQPEPEE